MKKEDSKPAAPAPAPRLLRKKSEKMLSDSYLPMVGKMNIHQHWMLYAAKNCASENDMETAYIPPPQMQAAMPQQGPEPPLFGHVVSDNVLLQPANITQSVAQLVNQRCKGTSDAILAHPNVRALLHEDVGYVQAKKPTIGKGGVKQQALRAELDELRTDKYYEGKIVRRTHMGLLIDINATVCGLLRWKCLRGVPRNLQKIGGFLGNLLVSKADALKGKINLKLETIGYYHDTMEETDLDDIENRVLSWAGIPGAPAVTPMKGEVPPPAPSASRDKPAIEKRLRRTGKMGPRF